MITVKDYLAYEKSITEAIQSKVDEWLQKQVFPTFYNNKGYDVPEWTTTTQLQLLLEQRGWSVTTYSDYQGSFVYLSVPPQQD
jgi:hypothetical protein